MRNSALYSIVVACLVSLRHVHFYCDVFVPIRRGLKTYLPGTQDCAQSSGTPLIQPTIQNTDHTFSEVDNTLLEPAYPQEQVCVIRYAIPWVFFAKMFFQCIGDSGEIHARLRKSPLTRRRAENKRLLT